MFFGHNSVEIIDNFFDHKYRNSFLFPLNFLVPIVELQHENSHRQWPRLRHSHCAALGKENVILVSIHANAAGNGSKWLNATGWSVYTSKGCMESDNLATCLAEADIKNLSGRKIRSDWSDGDIDFEESFYLLTKTQCAACLTENGFMDSRESLAYISSRAGKDAITDLHVEGIIEYLEGNI